MKSAVGTHRASQSDGSSFVIPKTSSDPVFETFWRFAAERQRVYEQRLKGQPAPWTTDPVLSGYRFTNVFRAADRVSQFLIRDVIYKGDQTIDNLVFRILLFKFFNKIETWQLFCREFGDVSLSTFDFDVADHLLVGARARGQTIYSSAYIVPPISGSDGVKHRGHLRQISTMINDDLPSRINSSDTMQEVFLLLRSYAGIGSFLAYQFTIDINYSTVIDFDEDDFVEPGPGALDGISKVYPNEDLRDASKIIRRMTDEQEEWLNYYELPCVGLFGRRLHLIDVQNLFCEISKYARVAHPEIEGVSGRTRIKQTFRPAGPMPAAFFPPKWCLSSLFNQCDADERHPTFV